MKSTSIDVPGARAHKPSTSTTMAGSSAITSTPPGSLHGFLRDTSGTFTTIDIPGAIVTALTGINDRGQMIGGYVDAGGNESRLSCWTMASSRSSMSLAPCSRRRCAINDNGVVVGTATDDAGRIRGFVWKDGTFTPLRAPGAFFWSGPVDIDERGRIVGSLFCEHSPPSERRCT